MNLLMRMEPIIGVVVIAVYMVYLRVFYYLKSLKEPDGRQRVTYYSGLRIYLFADKVSKRDRILFYCLLVIEVLLIIISLIVPKIMTVII